MPGQMSEEAQRYSRHVENAADALTKKGKEIGGKFVGAVKAATDEVVTEVTALADKHLPKVERLGSAIGANLD